MKREVPIRDADKRDQKRKVERERKEDRQRYRLERKK